MTLVEVLAGLAILGSLLASILVARARFTHQWALGQDRARAVAAADALLTQWWRDDLGEFPTSGSGEIAGHEGEASLRWSVEARESPESKDLGVQVVRLEVGTGEPQAAPLAVVELLAPLPPDEEATP